MINLKYGCSLKEAIKRSKVYGEWSVVAHKPTTVDVDFVHPDGNLDQTQFDLYSETPERELEVLYSDFCKENNFAENTVRGVYAYGRILD